MCSIITSRTKTVQNFSHCTTLIRLVAEKDAFKLKRFEIEKIVKNFFSYEEEMNIGCKTHDCRINKVMRIIANKWTIKPKRKRKTSQLLHRCTLTPVGKE